MAKKKAPAQLDEVPPGCEDYAPGELEAEQEAWEEVQREQRARLTFDGLRAMYLAEINEEHSPEEIAKLAAELLANLHLIIELEESDNRRKAAIDRNKCMDIFWSATALVPEPKQNRTYAEIQKNKTAGADARRKKAKPTRERLFTRYLERKAEGNSSAQAAVNAFHREEMDRYREAKKRGEQVILPVTADHMYRNWLLKDIKKLGTCE